MHLSKYTLDYRKTNGNFANQQKHNHYKRWRHRGSTVKGSLPFNPALASAIPVNKVLLQELNRFTGIKMLTSDFLTFFWLLVPISRGGNNPFCPSADTHESIPLYLLKNKMSLKKFQVIWQPNFRGPQNFSSRATGCTSLIYTSNRRYSINENKKCSIQ